MPKFPALILSLFLAPQAMAGIYIPGLASAPLKTSDNALALAGFRDFEDEVMDDHALQLNEAQRLEAKVWGLNEQEETRYLQLMRSRSGIYYKGLDLTPIDILGLNARTDAERRHFAELAARQEAQKVTQNIAWNNAFYQAYNELFKDIPVIGDFDPSPYSPYAHQPLSLHEGEQLYFFIKPDDAVTTVLLQLIDAINRTPNTRLHLLFLDMDSEAIQRFANQYQIPISLVTSLQITLNNGEQQFDALSMDKKKTPLLLLSRGQASLVVDLGRF